MSFLKNINTWSNRKRIKKIRGLLLLLVSIGILIVFLVSSYNILFKSDKYNPDSMMMAVAFGLMVSTFVLGKKLIKKDK
jgi:hypothetical protein